MQFFVCKERKMPNNKYQIVFDVVVMWDTNHQRRKRRTLEANDKGETTAKEAKNAKCTKSVRVTSRDVVESRGETLMKSRREKRRKQHTAISEQQVAETSTVWPAAAGKPQPLQHDHHGLVKTRPHAKIATWFDGVNALVVIAQAGSRQL